MHSGYNLGNSKRRWEVSKTKKTQKLYSRFHSGYYAYNHIKIFQVGKDVVAHAFTSRGRARQISVSSKPDWSTYRVLGHPGIHRKALSKTEKSHVM